MRRYPKKAESAVLFPALKAEVRELVHLPRRSPDAAATFAYRPTHAEEMALGSLFVIGHIEDAQAQEQTLLNSLFLELRRTYYHGTHGLPEERFHRTLQQLNTYLREHAAEATFTSRPLRCHIHIMVIADGTILVSEIGSVFSYVVRGGLISSVSHKNPPELASTSAFPFTHLVRGKLLAEDRLLAVTPHFIDTSLIEKIDSAFLSPLLLEELVQHAKAHLAQDVRSNGRAAAAIIVRIAQNLPIKASGTYPRPDHATTRHAPSEHAPLQTAKTHGAPLPLNRMLENMLPVTRDREDAVRPLPQKRWLRLYALCMTAHAFRWYTVLPLAIAIILWGTLPRIAQINSEIQSRELLNDRLDRITLQVKMHLGGRSQTEKRSLLAELAGTLDESLFQKSIPAEAAEARNILENSIRQIDRFATASVSILADFSKLTIEFSPEIVLENGTHDYFIAEKSLVQLLRVTPACRSTSACEGTQGSSPRLVITGAQNPGVIFAITKTAETPQRLALLGVQEFLLLEPRAKAYLEQKSKLPKTLTEPLLLASGVKEIFAVSRAGPIARKLLNAKKTDTFSVLALGKNYNSTGWRSVAIVSPSLYLLSEDQRIVQVLGGNVAGDRPLVLAEPLGADVRLRGLVKSGLLGILDEEHRRIIIVSPDGSVKKQYRHELFAGLRDIIEISENTFLVLTETMLLEVAG